VGSALYGTTYEGGTNCMNVHGCGTIFMVDPNSGDESVQYSFCSEGGRKKCTDGYYPMAGLIDVDGVLFGTTAFGGSFCATCGTVFSFDTGGRAETVLYAFCGNASCGQDPRTPLTSARGSLYGTTLSGGNTACGGSGCGTVFLLDRKTGAEAVLYAFCSQQNCTDGASPDSGLIDVKGMLYGTTIAGGIGNCPGIGGCGTVFAIDPKTRAETVLHSFDNTGADGYAPYGALLDVNGELYGTTSGGGAYGAGAVFTLDPTTGAETVVYSFQNNSTDGESPDSAMIDVKGTLYGMTGGGGTNGSGTVFAFDPRTGTEKVVYSFCSQTGCTDGSSPIGGLIDVHGTLYGVTYTGGAYDNGTVFAVTP
jgi:uncharacterized repeat protein (TIGR03803 family)